MIVLVVYVALVALGAHASGKGSFAIAVKRKPRATAGAGRRLLSKADAIPLHSYGADLIGLYSSGHEFFLTVELAGKQKFDLEVDTGSQLTYFPCKGCPLEVCGIHEHPYYDYDMSKTFRKLNCTTSTEDAAYCNAQPNVLLCDTNISYTNTCLFGIGYVDGSVGAGYMAEDTFTLGDELAPAKITFGCGGMHYPDGRNLRQDGMAGFSRGNTAFHTQLAKAGVIDAHVFGFCSEGMETSTAMLTLGRYNFGRRVPELAWTRMLGEDDLAVRTMSWKLGDKTIASSSNVYTVLDSGTTLTLLPSAMHHDFMTHLNETARNAGLSVVIVGNGTHCFYENKRQSSLTQHTLTRWFPSLTITYDPDVTLVLRPENYLFADTVNLHAFCAGIMSASDAALANGEQIILGQQTLRNTFVEYDLENSRVGMATVQCEKLREKFAPDTPHNPWKFVATVFILLFTACVIGGVSLCLYVKFWSRKPFKYQVFADETLDKEIEMGDLADT